MGVRSAHATWSVIPMTEETAHHLLQRRRRELEAQISALKGQLAPKEAELAQIDKMLAVAGPPPASVAPSIPQRNSNPTDATDYVSMLLPFLENAETIDQARESIRGMLPAAQDVEEIRKVIRDLAVALVPEPKFAHMTIKGLAVQALIDHFPHGGKVADIREFIRVGYSRDVDTASLRPQMHRLKADNVLVQNGEIWNLDPRKRRLYAQYNHPSSRAAMPELKDEQEDGMPKTRLGDVF